MNRLLDARTVVRRAIEYSDGRALVAFSGGKDSKAVLNLLVEAGADVECFGMYLVRGLRSFEAPIERDLARYAQAGKVIPMHYIPHWDLARHYRDGILMTHKRRGTELRKTTIADAEALIRGRTGKQWVAYGQKMIDSLERRGMISKCDAVDPKTRRFYPLRHWSDRDVFAYLRAEGIPKPPVIGRGRTSGIDLSPPVLRDLRDHYPDDYAKICAVFDMAPAVLARMEMRPELWDEYNPKIMSARRKAQRAKQDDGT